MRVIRTDVAILGAGLAGSLIALALAKWRRAIDVTVVEQRERAGGDHLWTVFGSDIGTAGRALLAPVVTGGWRGYDVRFPDYRRTIATPLYTIDGARLDAVLRRAIAPGRLLTGARALACSATAVTLADGTRIEADAVIDCRGLRSLASLTGGWHRAHTRALRLAAPHGLERPILADARGDQQGGYRALSALPLGPDVLAVTETGLLDGPMLPATPGGTRIDGWVREAGWTVAEVLADHDGSLPLIATGRFDSVWLGGGGAVARAGARAMLFDPLTGRAVRQAVRFALAVARQKRIEGEALARLAEAHARRHWANTTFNRRLAGLLLAAAPHERRPILAHVHAQDRRLIERLHAGRLTAADKARLLAGPFAAGTLLRSLTGRPAELPPLQSPAPLA